MQLVALRALQTGHLDDLRALCQRADEADGCAPKIHWPLLKVHNPDILHVLALEDEALLGLASGLIFEAGTLELTCVVDPCCRDQRVATTLVERLLEQHGHGVSRLRAGIASTYTPARAWVTRRGGVVLHREVTMHRTFVEDAAPPQGNALTLRVATADDAPALALLDAAAFGTERAEMQRRYQKTAGDPDRRVWLAAHAGDVVGKLHARRDLDGTVWVHDLCIDAAARGRGWGREMVDRCTHALSDGALRGPAAAVWLEVNADNAAALATYARCGYEIAREDDIYEVMWEVALNSGSGGRVRSR